MHDAKDLLGAQADAALGQSQTDIVAQVLQTTSPLFCQSTVLEDQAADKSQHHLNIQDHTCIHVS